MSAENVEVVRQAFRAWDANDLEAARSVVHEDIEFRAAREEPEVGAVRGVEAVASFLNQWRDTFDELRAEPLEFIDLGECVVVPLHISAHLPASEAEVTHDETHVYRLRDGKIAEIHDFHSRKEALAFAAASREDR